MAGEERVSLRSGAVSVEVDSEHGGRLSALVVEGHPLLFSAGSMALQWGAYPMVPWAGRVADGRFRFAGQDHELPRNLPPHAAHGIGFTSSWTVLDRGTDHLELGLDLDERWPFGGRVTQRFAVEPGSLRLEMTVTAGQVAMPVLVGWHPWFNRFLGTPSGPPVEAELSVEARSMYELDARAIPTGRLVAPSPRPWDNCFTDIVQEPTLTWPGLIELRLTSSCDHWVIYDQPGHAICVEPQSGAPDAFNRDQTTLAPGEDLEAWFHLAWA